MQTLNRLYTRFKQMKYTPVTGGIAFDPLAHALNKEETILKLIEGAYQTSVGLVIATDLRIFYIGVNRFNKTTLEQIAYEDIVSISITEPKIISVEIIIQARNQPQLTIKGCDYNEGKQFVELIRMLTLYNNAVPQAS
jgi:hypothetical protein